MSFRCRWLVHLEIFKMEVDLFSRSPLPHVPGSVSALKRTFHSRRCVQCLNRWISIRESDQCENVILISIQVVSENKAIKIYSFVHSLFEFVMWLLYRVTILNLIQIGKIVTSNSGETFYFDIFIPSKEYRIRPRV